MKYGHLERIKVTLRTLAPLFIGSGEEYSKKEYIYEPDRKLIHFPDLVRLTEYLRSRQLFMPYEKFLLNPQRNDLRLFLQENNIMAKDYVAFVQYAIDAGEAAQSEKFHGVQTFIKDAHGLPYIPGSSLKGAIRTAIAAHFINKGDYNWARQKINRADTSSPPRRYLKYESENLEQSLFQRLEHKNPNTNELIRTPVNDIMQGIRVSDSLPLGFESLTLVGKYDRRPDGSINSLNIYRECLKPNSETTLYITLDKPMLSKAGLTIDDIENILHSFADKYYETFEQHFAELAEDADPTANEGVDIIIGGGVGYPSKTLIYNLYPSHPEAVHKTSTILAKQFPSNHGHHKDASQYKISPHMLKTTRYMGEYYQMGRCELIIK